MLKTYISTKLVALWIVLVGALSPALANDSELGTPTGSFVVSKNPHIAMRSELLQISADKIRVEYTYENTSDEAENIIIGFPVARYEYQFHSKSPGELNVQTWIDGKEYSYENSDFIQAEECRSRWLERNSIFEALGYCFEYDRSLKFFDNDGCIGHEITLKPEHQTRIERLLSEENVLGCSYLNGRQWSENEDLWLEYFVGDTLTFVREQHFAPNSIVKVVHEYVPASAHGIPMYSVQNFAEVDTRDLTFWDQGLAGLHMECVSKDDAEIAVRGWERYLQQEQKAGRGTMHSGVVDWYLIDYILTTGANWRGPIGHFRLEIFDEDPLLISTCFEGLQRVADNRYVFEAHDFVPTENLSVVLHYAMR